MFETMQKIAIVLMVGAAAVGAVRDWSRDVPSVTADYYTQTRTGGWGPSGTGAGTSLR